MDNYRVKFTRQAEKSLETIVKYISQDLMNPSAAIDLLQLIDKETESLSNMPERIRLTPEQPWHDKGIRRKRVKNYYIYFWIHKDARRVQILDITYTGRNQRQQLANMMKDSRKGD